MRSQDRISAEPEVVYENCGVLDDVEGEDMWSLIKPEPRADAFDSLLSGKEFKERTVKPSWDLAPSKAYVPVNRSRSSLSSDSLKLCTEGLGCESCDGLTDSASDESSSVILDDYSFEEQDGEIDYEVMEREETVFPAAIPARSFPPPLQSLCASSASYMRSVKKDGRFVLRSVKMPTQNYLHTFREGGRLKMQIVSRAEDDFVIPQASTLIKTEKEILHQEVDGGGGSDSEEIKSCFIDNLPILEEYSDIPEVQESEDFSKIPDAVSVRGGNCKGCEIQNQNAVAEFKGTLQPQECKLKDNKSVTPKSVENDIDPSPASVGSACFNVYSGWRTELAEQNSSVFCHNWQKAQSLPNYPLNTVKYAEANNMNLNVNVNESCVHARVPKLRLNDLGLGRCHAPKSLSVWGKSQCIATNS